MEKDLSVKVQFIKGVGPKLAEKLHKLGIETVRDLIYHWPRAYIDFTNISKIADCRLAGDNASAINFYGGAIGGDQAKAIRCRIIGIGNKTTSRQRIKITEAIVEDGTGTLKLIWFNQPFLTKLLRPGSGWIFRGKLSYNNFTHELVMESPMRMKEPCIIPVYPETAGITSFYLNKLIRGLKTLILQQEEYLPEAIIGRYELSGLSQAIASLHFPANLSEVNKAQRRIAFDELLMVALQSRLTRRELLCKESPELRFNKEEIDSYVQSLPFELTSDQLKAAEQVLSDIQNNHPMSRLLNGDVGSGKTVVAAIAAYAAVKSGYRVVLMAPTEVLSSQHYETFCKLFGETGLKIGLMTSNIKKISNEEVQNPIKAKNDRSKRAGVVVDPESADIVIGTHALLQKKVSLRQIGLVIVDEQHRFGVAQRAQLKSINNEEGTVAISDAPKSGLLPHFLSMTATPIPRSLHLALFGDLDVSVIKEKPKNRKTIKTRLVEPVNRDKAYDFVRRQIEAGRQIFVICPLIEETAENEAGAASYELWDQDRKSVVKETERLQKEIFPRFRVAMLHGKMKPKEKESILTDFANKKYDILVSTSVIEVGIDIPNAAVMMIEDAERFGLAQIHQFRGRVGRGEHQSFCLLFSNSKSPQALQRLHDLEMVSDGFELAEIDLETRGPGDLFGTMQSGQLELKMASISDRILVAEASEAADFILSKKDLLAGGSKLAEKLAQVQANNHLE